jgi:hypothetical protein
VGVEVGLGGVDDPAAVGLGLDAGRPPGGDSVAAQDDADGFGVGVVDGGDVEAQLEARSAPRDPGDAVPEDLLGQRLAVGGGGEGDARGPP